MTYNIFSYYPGLDVLNDFYEEFTGDPLDEEEFLEDNLGPSISDSSHYEFDCDCEHCLRDYEDYTPDYEI